MTRDMKLADEILTLASATSLDYQEHVLDVVKAMNFTRNVVQKMCIRDRFLNYTL